VRRLGTLARVSLLFAVSFVSLQELPGRGCLQPYECGNIHNLCCRRGEHGLTGRNARRDSIVSDFGLVTGVCPHFLSGEGIIVARLG
jgi:hypothetical protein